MSTLTIDQIAQDMRNAGFPASSIPIGTAIVLAESGGRTDAVNNSDPYGGSWGLWQINGAHFNGETTVGCALDPQCATNFAFQLSSGGQNWTPWGTYTSGAYQQYLNGNPSSSSNQFSTTVPAGTGPGGCPGKGQPCTCPPGYSVTTNNLGTPICKNNSFPYNTASCKECPGSSDPLTKISNFLDSISQFGQWLGDPVRIIKLVFGILLIGGAILLIASPQSQIAQGIKGTARRVGIH